MRRKQLYAIILAGALAASSAPAAVMAAEGDVAATAETSEETPVEGDTTDNSTAETPAQETQTTEAPAQETTAATEAPAQAAATTEAPAQEAAATEAPAAEQTQQVTEETPVAEATEAPAAGEGEEGTQTQELAEGESETETAFSITVTKSDNTTETHYFTTLQAAVNYVKPYDEATNPDATVIEVSNVTGDIVISDAVVVKDKRKVCIRAKQDNVIIKRDASYDGDMFQISGDKSELQFDVKDGATLTVSGATGSEDVDATGAIVAIGKETEAGTGAAFGLGTGVTLTGNDTSAVGGAITNYGGNIVLKGGTITGNTGTKGGAIYSNTSVNVQGTVVVKDNKINETTVSNICLDGDAVIAVTGELTGSNITFSHIGAADKKLVAQAKFADGTENPGDKFKAAFAGDGDSRQIRYENEAAYTLTLAADNLSATLVKVADPNPNPNPNPENPTPTPIPLKLTYTSGSLKWEDHSTVSLKMTADGACKWYYFLVDANTDTTVIQAMYSSSKATNAVAANKEFSVTVKNVPEEDKWLVVCAKPDNGGTAKMSVIKLNGSSFKKKRPAATPSVTTRAAQNNKVSQSTVTGLENALKFFPGKFYEFSVTGAGMDITDPVAGDVRWVPMYWSTVKNPTTKQQNTTWRIGSGKGIQNGNTYNMYIFFKKQTYNGKEWQDTDVIQSITTKFTAASISDKEWKEYIAELSGTPSQDGGSGSGDGGDGDETDAELTATAAASEKDASSKSKSAVSTADESPIGSMSALAALSLLAGGYIVVRKRKKEEQ